MSVACCVVTLLSALPGHGAGLVPSMGYPAFMDIYVSVRPAGMESLSLVLLVEGCRFTLPFTGSEISDLSVKWSGVCKDGLMSGTLRVRLHVPLGVTRYEGDVDGGYFSGAGVLELSDGVRYEGEFRQGTAEGRGVWSLPTGVRFEGQFVAGALEGAFKGALRDDVLIEGEFRDRMRQGQATITGPLGLVYVGAIGPFGLPDGRGRTTTASGGTYEGGFRQGVKDGNGVMTWPSGNRYDGEFRLGLSNCKTK